MTHFACNFPFDKNHLESLENSLSPGRLQLYRKLASDDDIEAMKLYCWNNAISQALFWPLHGAEISLRNAMADRIYDKYGDDWFDQLATLKRGKKGGPNEEAEKVEKAKQTLARDGETAGHDSIVASISFGFWEGLLKPEYELMLWKEHGMFSEIFPESRDDTFKKINQIKRLRNNIAHHEPIFVHWPSKKFRDLFSDFKKIIKVIRWVCPETAKWVEHHSSADFYAAWNSAPTWLTQRKQLKVKPGATAAAEAESDNWCW